MNIWQVLQIAPTKDIKAIQTAYRTLLKTTHPEEKPEEFKALRQAYESAIKLAETDDNEAPSIQQKDEKDPLILELETLLEDASRRFNLQLWQQWVEQYHLVSLDRQQIIFNQLINAVLPYADWFIGEIYELLWETFEWQGFTEQEDSREFGEYLYSLTRQRSLLDPDELSNLTAIEQKALLSVLTPLSQALHYQNINAIRQLLDQAQVIPVFDSPVFQLALLKLYSVIEQWPDNIFQPMITEFLNFEQVLVADIWQQFARVCLNKQWQQEFYSCIDKLMEQQEYGAASWLLMQWHLDKDPQLALGLAHLVHHWQAKPVAYWRHERRLRPDLSEFGDQDLICLYQELMQQTDTQPMSFNLSEVESASISKQMLCCHLVAREGKIAQIQKLIQATQTEHFSYGWQLWQQLVHIQLTEIIEFLSGSETVIAMLEYKQQPQPTAELIASLSKAQWLELLYRYPDIPTNWLEALKQQEIIPNSDQPLAAIADELFQDDEKKAYYWYLKQTAKDTNTISKIANIQYQFAQQYDCYDPCKAVQWYLLAAENGHVDAQNNLAWHYNDGKGVKQDHSQSLFWHLKAVEQGHSGSMVSAGYQYDNAQGTKKDQHKAFDLYLMAAELGNRVGQFNLAVMYQYGKGIEKDYKQAFHWYQQAAEQDDVDAQYKLGSFYEEGYGVEKDHVKAIYWYEKASANGHQKAKKALKKLQQGNIVEVTVKPRFLNILGNIWSKVRK